MNNEILERLKKVLTLAAKGGTQGEMDAAMAKAKEMAMRYQIDLASIDMEAGDEKSALAVDTKTEGGVKTKSAYVRKHHRWVFAVITEVFDVKFVRSLRKRGSREIYEHLWMVGEVNDLAIAKEILKWLDGHFPKLYRKCVDVYYKDDAASQHGFYRGLYAGIVEANKKQEEALAQDDKNKWALVVQSKQDAVKRQMEESFAVLKAEKSKQTRENSAALHQGYKHGKSINLNQVGG